MAIKLLKDFGQLSEMDINEEIAKKIANIKFDESIDNNLKDLAQMNFKLYLTTNYDHSLNRYITSGDIPICLADFDFNTQNLFSLTTKKIFHLHGHVSNPGTIVISEDSYNELYNKERYKKLFNLLGASKAFMFVGMSLDDQFMKKLIKDHVDVFKSKGFILLDKSLSDKFSELKTETNIEVIEYDSKGVGHVEAIRNILQEIES